SSSTVTGIHDDAMPSFPPLHGTRPPHRPQVAATGLGSLTLKRSWSCPPGRCRSHADVGSGPVELHTFTEGYWVAAAMTGSRSQAVTAAQYNRSPACRFPTW